MALTHCQAVLWDVIPPDTEKEKHPTLLGHQTVCSTWIKIDQSNIYGQVRLLRYFREASFEGENGQEPFFYRSKTRLIIHDLFELSGHVIKQRVACMMIANLAGLNEYQRSVIQDAFGVVAVLSVIARHPMDIDTTSQSEPKGDSIVVYHSIRAIWNLSYNDAIANRIIDLGGIPLLISAMHQHRESADVQHVACGAVANLTYCIRFDSEKYYDTLALGAFDSVVRAMDIHSNNEAIQAEGCRTLAHMFQVATKVRLVVGTLPVVVMAYRNHRNNNNVLKYAQYVLNKYL